MEGEIAFIVFIGFMIGLIVMTAICMILIKPRVDILADGICKLKYGEEYQHTDIDWTDSGNVEVLCESYQKPDIDSIIIKEG